MERKDGHDLRTFLLGIIDSLPVRLKYIGPEAWLDEIERRTSGHGRGEHDRGSRRSIVKPR